MDLQHLANIKRTSAQQMCVKTPSPTSMMPGVQHMVRRGEEARQRPDQRLAGPKTSRTAVNPTVLFHSEWLKTSVTKD